MELGELNPAEQLVWQAFPLGRPVDLTQADDPTVRAEVLCSLLLGTGQPVPGAQARLLLKGASITGRLDLAYADIQLPIELHDCKFTNRINFYGARLRHLSLSGSAFPGLVASYAIIDGNLRLRGCRITATIHTIGTTVSGSILLDGAHLSDSELAWSATSLRVTHDIVAHDGFVCHGELRLNDAEVGGSLRWEGAQLVNPGGRTLFAPDISVGAVANLCDGFRSEGRLRLNYARIGSRLCFDGAELIGSDGRALLLSYLQASELVLQPANPIAGQVDLSHARVAVIRDDPKTWPTALRLTGLRYETLTGIDTGVDRLPWLRLDPLGYQPQPYEQLAEAYRLSGRPDEARMVLLAKQRHQRETITFIPKLWGYLQDLIVGYGYRPMRAAIALLIMLVLGTTIFSLKQPAPSGSSAPDFNPFIYSLDLLLPIINFGLEDAYHPRGADAWLKYTLIAAGWILATTIAAGIGRTLRRS